MTESKEQIQKAIIFVKNTLRIPDKLIFWDRNSPDLTPHSTAFNPIGLLNLAVVWLGTSISLGKTYSYHLLKELADFYETLEKERNDKWLNDPPLDLLLRIYKTRFDPTKQRPWSEKNKRLRAKHPNAGTRGPGRYS